MHMWKPNATVAAVVERDGRFLMVEEQTSAGLRLNQPAGHLEPCETLVHAAVRETLEETAQHVEVMRCLGVYMSRYDDVTYLRFAFACRWLCDEAGRVLDEDIVRAVWLTPDEIRGRAPMYRGPFVMQVVDDYLAGRGFPVELIHAHPNCLAPLPEGTGGSH